MDWSALSASAPPPIKRVFQDRNGTRKDFSLSASLEQKAANRALVRLEGGCSGKCWEGAVGVEMGLFKYLGHFFSLSVYGSTKSSSLGMWREAETQKRSSKGCDCISFYLYRVFDKKVILSPFTGGNSETQSIWETSDQAT